MSDHERGNPEVGEQIPEFVCVGQEICLQASGADGEQGDYQWTVLEFASFVGGNTGPQVTVRIDEPGDLCSGSTPQLQPTAHGAEWIFRDQILDVACGVLDRYLFRKQAPIPAQRFRVPMRSNKLASPVSYLWFNC